jgi:hypothetical protein
MTPYQCRAARALLDMSQTELSGAAIVPLVIVEDFEAQRSTPTEDNVSPTSRIRRGFCENAIIFAM